MQFERQGYFVRDKDLTLDRLVLNRTIGLRDTFAKEVGKTQVDKACDFYLLQSEQLGTEAGDALVARSSMLVSFGPRDRRT